MALLLWGGGPWRTLGAGYTTVFQTFTKWTAAGAFERAYAAGGRVYWRSCAPPPQ